MAYLAIDLFSFPNEEIVKKFEEACEAYKEFDKDLIFVGLMARDTLGKYTHAMVWKYDDISGREDIQKKYLDSLETSSSPLGDFPGYLFEHWYGFRVVAFDDPLLKEHGLAEWNRREAENAISIPPGTENLERVAEYFDGLNKLFAKDWTPEQLERAGWVYKIPESS